MTTTASYASEETVRKRSGRGVGEDSEVSEDQGALHDQGNKVHTDDEVSDTDEESSEEGNESKGFIEAFNNYLGSIFATEEEQDEEMEKELSAMYSLLWKILSASLGIIAIVVIFTKYPEYLGLLHENQLWFSNIKEVEREISFRTEQGLYYSYFKEIVEAPSWSEGVSQLQRDNRTEHGRTINILHRFNVLPELLLSAIYKWWEVVDSPSVFYVWAVFSLHGVYTAGLYLTSWLLSDSILAGMISLLLFVVHRVDSTRVNYTVPLRESFAIPLLFLQILATCCYIRAASWQVFQLLVIFFLTTTFLLSWQFGPFVLLCQLFCVVVLGRLHLLAAPKVLRVVLVLGLSVLVSCWIQSAPPLVVSSPVLSMVVPALILSASPAQYHRGLLLQAAIAAAELSLLLLATVLINGSIKIVLKVDADSHLYQLFLAKLQMGDLRHFDSRLYMCTDAFKYLDWDTITRLSESWLLPLYLTAILLYCTATLRSLLTAGGQEAVGHDEGGEVRAAVDPPLAEEEAEAFSASPVCLDRKTTVVDDRPDLVLFVAVSVVWSILAALILRLKVLWLPTVCVLAGVVLADHRLYTGLCVRLGHWSAFLPRFFPEFLRISICCGYMGYLVQEYWGRIALELWPEELYEFWDPDTVELMEWVRAHTPPASVFSGSMQLLAAVKLCTGRAITNHPHYEDSWLRHRTHQVYQIYGRQSAEVVHGSLREMGVTHIILEDSICLAPPDPDNPLCRLTDIVDLHNGHVPEESIKGIKGLQTPQHGRFCDMIRHPTEEYRQLTSLVMSNKTFRVYRLANTTLPSPSSSPSSNSTIMPQRKYAA